MFFFFFFCAINHLIVINSLLYICSKGPSLISQGLVLQIPTVPIQWFLHHWRELWR
jgi:hypothetical protein